MRTFNNNTITTIGRTQSCTSYMEDHYIPKLCWWTFNGKLLRAQSLKCLAKSQSAVQRFNSRTICRNLIWRDLIQQFKKPSRMKVVGFSKSYQSSPKLKIFLSRRKQPWPSASAAAASVTQPGHGRWGRFWLRWGKSPTRSPVHSHLPTPCYAATEGPKVD